jgi:type I restriction enzyme M protein
MSASLNGSGRAIVVLDTGAVSRGSGGPGSNRERQVRKQFIDHDLIEAVVLLPENLFYNTTAAGVLLCLNKKKSRERVGKITLINASKECEKGRPKNFMPDANIARIVDAFAAGENVAGFVKVITNEQAAKEDYNLSPSRYVATDGAAEVLPVEDAIVLLREAEAERRTADQEFGKAMDRLGLGGWRV